MNQPDLVTFKPHEIEHINTYKSIYDVTIKATLEGDRDVVISVTTHDLVNMLRNPKKIFTAKLKRTLYYITD